MSEQQKQHLGIVIVGHVDAGKSTSTGRLLFELGGIKERELEKLKEEAKALGKESFFFAFVMDQDKNERERGVTIKCTAKEFFTSQYHYTIIDAPGHRDFVKNMVTGSSQADVALLMVPANKGGFETAIAKGNHKKNEIEGQTRQHARLLNLIGVDQMIVGINKMDAADYSEERFNEIKTYMLTMLKKIGFKSEKIAVIPLSGMKGDNFNKLSDKMPWYKGFEVTLGKKDKKEIVKGITLVDALDKVSRVPKRKPDAELRIPMSESFQIKGKGYIVTGRVEQGTLARDMEVKFVPSGAVGKVGSIEMHHRDVEKALPGFNVGINIKGLTKDNQPHKGDIIVPKNSKLSQVTEFTAVVQVQEHPHPIKVGFAPLGLVRTAKSACKITKINWRLGEKTTAGEKVMNPLHIETGDTAECVFAPERPITLEKFDDCKQLARISFMDSNQLKMLGKVTDVTYKTA